MRGCLGQPVQPTQDVTDGWRSPRLRSASSSGSQRTGRPGRSGTCAPRPSARPAGTASGWPTSTPPSTASSRPRSPTHCVAFNDPDPLTARPRRQRSSRGGRRSRNRSCRPTGLAARPTGRRCTYSLAGCPPVHLRRPSSTPNERILESAAARTGGRTISEVRVGIAIAEAAANGHRSSTPPSSRWCARWPPAAAPSSSPSRPPAPARPPPWPVLTRAWQDSGGTVVGLAPSAVAAQELGASHQPRERRRRCRSQAQACCRGPWRPGRETVRSRHPGQARLARRATAEHPTWMERIDPKTLVLIDEAGHGRHHRPRGRDRLHHLARRQVRLVGDDRQLAAVAAGGVTARHRPPDRRRHPQRSATASATPTAASTTPRQPPPSPSATATRGARVLRRPRPHPRRRPRCLRRPGLRRLGGRPRRPATDSIAARTHPRPRRRAQHPRPQRPPRPDSPSTTEDRSRVVTLADGTRGLRPATVIITRHNNRRLAISRDRLGQERRPLDRHPGQRRRLPDRAPRHSSARPSRCPPTTSRKHVQLGYATTVHGAQGITTDTCTRRPDRRRRPQPALRRALPRPLRQPPLPRHSPPTATRTP